MRRRDIDDWSLARQMATRPDEPIFYRLQELYSYVMLDAHLQSQVQLRKSRVLGSAYELATDKGDINEEASAALRSQPLVRQLIDYCLDSVYYGHSLVELQPQRGGTVQAVLIDRRHINPIGGIAQYDMASPEGILYRETREYGRTLLEFVSQQPLGLLDMAVPHVLYKRFAQACWSEYCEICGIPIRYIKTNTQDAELRERYEQVLANQGSNMNALIDTDDEIGFITGNSSDGSGYQNLIRLCTNEISLLVSGAVLGQDTEFGSNSKEQTSAELSAQIIESDIYLVEQAMNTTVLPALVALGIVPQGFRFQFSQQEDTSQLFSQAMQAAAYFDIDPEWMRQKFGIEVTGPRTMGMGSLSRNTQNNLITPNNPIAPSPYDPFF